VWRALLDAKYAALPLSANTAKMAIIYSMEIALQLVLQEAFI
jgi:hypothetical protein